jgi:hypothetical protein
LWKKCNGARDQFYLLDSESDEHEDVVIDDSILRVELLAGQVVCVKQESHSCQIPKERLFLIMIVVNETSAPLLQHRGRFCSFRYPQVPIRIDADDRVDWRYCHARTGHGTKIHPPKADQGVDGNARMVVVTQNGGK